MFVFYMEQACGFNTILVGNLRKNCQKGGKPIFQQNSDLTSQFSVLIT